MQHWILRPEAFHFLLLKFGFWGLVGLNIHQPCWLSRIPRYGTSTVHPTSWQGRQASLNRSGACTKVQAKKPLNPAIRVHVGVGSRRSSFQSGRPLYLPSFLHSPSCNGQRLRQRLMEKRARRWLFQTRYRRPQRQRTPRFLQHQWEEKNDHPPTTGRTECGCRGSCRNWRWKAWLHRWFTKKGERCNERCLCVISCHHTRTFRPPMVWGLCLQHPPANPQLFRRTSNPSKLPPSAYAAASLTSSSSTKRFRKITPSAPFLPCPTNTNSNTSVVTALALTSPPVEPTRSIASLNASHTTPSFAAPCSWPSSLNPPTGTRTCAYAHRETACRKATAF